MNIRTIPGLILIILGLIVGYIDYLFVHVLYDAAIWIVSFVHGPQAIAILVTIALALFFGGLILTIGFIALYLILIGIGIELF